jgi:dihydropteroate synthase
VYQQWLFCLHLQIYKSKNAAMKVLQSKYINVNGSLLDLSSPCVMGILNVTPDSFYAGSRMQTEADITSRIEQIVAEGAAIIDVGAYSSRSNAENVSPAEEMERLRMGLGILRKVQPDAIVSVDTFRADVARMCVEEYGVAIINDIAAGEMDDDMFRTVADLNVPYIMMHMQGTPQNMQQHPHYDNLLKEVFMYFARKVQQLRDLGVKDIILDPGFGFGKTIEHNYELLAHLEEFRIFELPLLVGVSRKSMIYRLLGTTPQEALNGTTVLDTICLLKGADILRVHDVRFLLITIAPSCNGLFLKKIFSIRRWFISALIISPVRTTSSNGILCSTTINAPTFCLPILIQAITTGIISSCSILSFLFPVKKRTNALAC